MNILLAPDKFKGSIDAAGLRAALRTGLLRARPDLSVTELPLADGGDGTVAALLASGWSAIPVKVCGPTGAPVKTQIAMLQDARFVELASCCGLALLDAPAPHTASTYGLGEAIRAALETPGIEPPARLIVGLGGSASIDGGAGMLQALGARLTAEDGTPIARGLDGLRDLARVDLGPARETLRGVTLEIASDVTAPLIGLNGAAEVFGPQKGLRDIALADRALALLATKLEIDPETPGAGAAGGTGAALLALGAQMRSGADLILAETGAPQAIDAADLVVTGEGRMDAQSLMGKAPLRLVAAARAQGKPVIAVCGISELSAAEAGLQEIYALSTIEPDSARSIANPGPLLEQIGAQIAAKLP